MHARAPNDPKLSKHLLDRRLEGFAAGSSLALFPTFASIAVLLMAYGGHTAPGILLAWVGGVVLVVLARIAVARRILPLSAGMAALQSQWRAVNAVLVSGSLTWAIGLPLAAWLSPASGLSALSVIGAALLCGVLLMHRTAPAAAIFHILALASGLALAHWMVTGWQAWPLLALIAIFAVTLIAAILSQDRLFRSACQLELDRQESEQAVRMLLDDHEAQAADWRWTVDGGGALRDVSDRFAEVLGAAPDTLSGLDFLSLLEPGRERDRMALLIAEGTAFRDEPVPVAMGGERRFWRLSGHPRADGGMTGVGRDVTDQREIEERVRAMAYVDPLTGLANRHLFNQRLPERLGGSGDDAKPMALLCLDLDDFKSANEAHGHIFGDSLLREMGARLRSESRESDLVARLGGDEFAILIEAPAGDGMLIERAHRLLAVLRAEVVVRRRILRVQFHRLLEPAGGLLPALLREVRAAEPGELVAELGVGDADQGPRALSYGLAAQLRDAVLGDHAVHISPGSHHARASLERWHNPRDGAFFAG